MEDTPKESKKENKAMSAKSILSCTEKCNDGINLIKNCMDGSKSIPTTNKDINIPLKYLKRVTTDVEIAASNHLTSYANILRKRKIVQEKDEFNLKKLNAEIAHYIKPDSTVRFFLKIKYSRISKTTSKKNRKNMHRNASSIIKIEKFDKQNSAPSCPEDRDRRVTFKI